MMRPTDRIFLIGARGAGKTTVASLLADRLGWRMVDADAEIERQTGCSIRSIFEREGESGFRQLEAETLRRLASFSRAVIATGGGVVVRPENRELLRRSGLVVWLRAEPEVLWRRMDTDPRTAEQRPALTSLGGLEEMQSIVAQRSKWYSECASLTIDTSARSPQDVAQMILEFLARTANEPH
ncbi:MAG: shikimate kinase AroL [Gemmatales bacterium]|nr:shikimate kinase AroL [Gemmatales bacterium]MDW8387420.1 shikimate kinase AroL [Gemmatales bacterium]